VEARSGAYLNAIMIWLKLTTPLAALCAVLAIVLMAGSSSPFA
jgi:hypothetical protein